MKEAPGHWLDVSSTVGDAMTFDIYSDQSKRVIQRSAIRPARPEEGGFPNHRVVWDEATEEEHTDETMDTQTSKITNAHQQAQGEMA